MKKVLVIVLTAAVFAAVPAFAQQFKVTDQVNVGTPFNADTFINGLNVLSPHQSAIDSSGKGTIAGTEFSLLFNPTNTAFPHISAAAVHLQAILAAAFPDPQSGHVNNERRIE